ncbi:MAG: hypothetical protein M3P33_02815 [bacterium]|nr:hypothetical protein [bacterium]
MIQIYKKKYQTCLQMLDALRVKKPELKDEILSYAGVLDPLAQGFVPVLVGREENQNRVHFTNAKKKYTFDVLVGVSTDTFDLLGLVTKFLPNNSGIDYAELENMFLGHSRAFDQTVSLFSNKKYKGKSLWEWGREGVLVPEEERPFTPVVIYDFSINKQYFVTKKKLKSDTELMKSNFDNTFRIDAVVGKWNAYFDKNNIDEYRVLSFDIFVSKGFYIRKLVEDISKTSGTPMLVYELIRNEVLDC